MAIVRKSLQGMRTLGRLADSRRVRSPGAALLEMSVMANERQRLNRELDCIARRQVAIAARMAEMSAKEQLLQTYIGTPQITGLVPSFQPTQRVKAKTFSY